MSRESNRDLLRGCLIQAFKRDVVVRGVDGRIKGRKKNEYKIMKDLPTEYVLKVQETYGLVGDLKAWLLVKYLEIANYLSTKQIS